MLNGFAEPDLKPEIIPVGAVRVPLTATLELMAAGKYDFVSGGFERSVGMLPRVALGGEGDLEVKAIGFGSIASTSQALQALSTMKLRPLNIRELLAVGVHFPDLQKMFLMVALGTRFSTSICERFAFLWGSSSSGSSSRYLCLNATEFKWPSYARFLVAPAA